MNLKKTVLRYVMCLSLLLAFSFALLPQMAQAASGAGWYFNGGVKNVVNNGAAATIETQNPYVYTGYKALSRFMRKNVCRARLNEVSRQ